VLDVEERSLDGPAESLAEVAGIGAAPVGPRAAPPGRGAVERESGGKEGAVVSGELELVVSLDPRELRSGEPRPDVALAGQGQPPGGLLAQALGITAVHGRTVAPARDWRQRSSAAGLPGFSPRADRLEGDVVGVKDPSSCLSEFVLNGCGDLPSAALPIVIRCVGSSREHDSEALFQGGQ
jgi:hypothetical protein